MNVPSLANRINGAKGRIALIPFLTAGFPTLARFWECMDELDEAGADIIEVGVPFSDPVADGPVVEAASQRALANGVTLASILKGLTERKGRYRSGIVLMGYYNPFLQYGLDRFAADALAAGVSGCIVPDLPLEEDYLFRSALAAQGLALIPLVGLNTSAGRMAAHARQAGYARCAPQSKTADSTPDESRGFPSGSGQNTTPGVESASGTPPPPGYVYLVSVLGATGQRAGFSPDLPDALDRAQTAFDLPVALGFGLSQPEQLAALPVRPQAVVFGSALLRHIDAGGSAAEFLRRWL